MPLSSTSTSTSAAVEDSFDPILEDAIADAEFDSMLCIDTQSVTSDFSGGLSSGTHTPTLKKRKANETSEILREFLANRPKPSDFIPQKPVDDIQHFLHAIAVTMRRLPPLAIARIKIKVANIVGEEIPWAEQNPVEYIYLDSNTLNQTTAQPTEQSTEQSTVQSKSTEMEH